MKSYTDLEQSKKLAEILPIESADRFYMFESINGEPHYHPIIITEHMNRNFIISEHNSGGGVISWSLAALLGVLPDYTLQTNTDGTVFVVCDSKKPMISDAYSNPVDACVGMIEKLHEQNLL